MASPEIELPRRLSKEDFAADADVTADKAESDSHSHDGSVATSLRREEGGHNGHGGGRGLAQEHHGSENDIVYHYLEFGTELPSPAHLSRPSLTSDLGQPQPTPCPDLQKYTSPFEWSSTHKNFMTWISVFATISSAYTAGSYAPGQQQMMDEWHISRTAASTGITVFTCGFGIAPMFLAPFSEMNGRQPVFLASGLVYVVLQLVCALTPTFAGMIVARFLVGCAASTFSTMVGGVVSDIYQAEDRNTAMSLFAGAAMFGTGLGPLVCGFIAEYTTWRWIFYHQVVSCGLLVVVIIFFFRETRGSVLLSRKAAALNKWYEQLESEGFYGVLMPIHSANEDKPHGLPPSEALTVQRIRWKVKSDEARASISVMIYTSISRPFHLLVTEPVVFFFSLWISFAWAVLYLLFSAIPLSFQTTYNFTLSQANAVFAATSISAILITIVSIVQDTEARRYFPARRAKTHQPSIFDTPEGRLYFCCVESVLLPIGCFWFGWTVAFRSVPWIVPALAAGCVTMGIFSVYLSVFNYLADAYGRYASSALAAQSFCRNMLAGTFPLFTPALFTNLTFQGAGSLLGGVAAVLTLVPWTLAMFGPKIRARSRVCREVMGGS